MPHLTLEYSANVAASQNESIIFSRLQDILVTVASIPVDNCKCRSYRAESFRVGNGNPNSGFVHLEIRLLEGRPADVKRGISEQSLDVLKKLILTEGLEHAIQITVDIVDIVRDSYSKHRGGTL